MKTLAKIAILVAAGFFSHVSIAETPEENYTDGLAALKAEKILEGRKLLRKAADAGHTLAQYELALDFLYRGGVAEAGRFFKMAADAGHAPSQVEFGLILQNSDQDVLAKQYYERASQQGSPEGDYHLAALLLTGQAGEKNPRRAMDHLKRAAEKGYEQAIEQLAFNYIIGTPAFTEEERASPEALKWIQKAVEIDYTMALDKMAEVHLKGLFGQPVDLARANELQAKSKKLKGEGDVVQKKNRRSK